MADSSEPPAGVEADASASPGRRSPRPPSLGVAFVGMAKVLGLPEAIAAGAVICGAYFGDKMTPLSETTILVPQLVGRVLTTGQHIKNMFWTAGPALGISLVIFWPCWWCSPS